MLAKISKFIVPVLIACITAAAGAVQDTKNQEAMKKLTAEIETLKKQK